MSAYRWESLNQEEAELLRGRGKDPSGTVVKRVGQDYLVFLHMKSREETVIRLNDRRTAE